MQEVKAVVEVHEKTAVDAAAAAKAIKVHNSIINI